MDTLMFFSPKLFWVTHRVPRRTCTLQAIKEIKIKKKYKKLFVYKISIKKGGGRTPVTDGRQRMKYMDNIHKDAEGPFIAD